MLDDLLQYVPVFVLVVFRIAGLMLYAPSSAARAFPIA